MPINPFYSITFFDIMKKPPPPAACAKMQMVTYKTKDKDIRPPPPPQLMHGVDLFEVSEIVSISENEIPVSQSYFHS